MTPELWQQTVNDISATVVLLLVSFVWTVVLLRRDKVRADREKRMQP